MKNTSCLMMAFAILISLFAIDNLLAQTPNHSNSGYQAMPAAAYIGHRGITAESAHQLYEKAYQSEVLGEYEKAIDLYSQTLMADDQHEQARFNRARLCYELNNYEYAIKAFDEIIDRNNMDAEAFELRGLSHYHLQRLEDAVNDFNQAFRLSGKEDILLHRGIALTKMGFYDDALLDLEKLLKSNDKHAAAMAARGDVMLALRRFQPAIHWYDKAIDLKETDAYAWCNRGIANMHLENFEAALIDFDWAIQLEANSRMYLNIAYCYYEMGETELAKKHGILAMKADPDNTEVYYLLGLAEMELNMPDLALQSFTIAVDTEPGNIDYLLAQATAFLATNDFYAAIQNCNIILDKDSKHEAGKSLLLNAFDELEQHNLTMLQTQPVVEMSAAILDNFSDSSGIESPNSIFQENASATEILTTPTFRQELPAASNSFYENPYGN